MSATGHVHQQACLDLISTNLYSRCIIGGSRVLTIGLREASLVSLKGWYDANRPIFLSEPKINLDST